MTADDPEFFRGKRLIVFGAGYVGRAVAQEAVSRGMRVIALTRNPAKVEGLVSAGCEVVIAELASDSWHKKISDRADFVLNCVSSGGGGVEGYIHSYVEGMRSVLAWAGSVGGVGTLLYTSSTSVYPQSGGVLVDETASTSGASGTSEILRQAEDLLREAPSSAGGRWFILRLAGIYGPGRHHLLDQLRAGETEFNGRGDHRLNLIHRDDIVSAVIAAFAAPHALSNQIFNLADDSPARKSEVVNWLAGRLGLAEPSFNGASVVVRRVATADRVIANQKIKTLLNWRPRYPDFRAGYDGLL